MVEPRLISVDCDLRKVHAWDEKLGRVCYRSPDNSQLLKHIESNIRGPVTVIYEIASATDYTDDAGGAVRYNKRRWMLWNMANAVRLHEALSIRGLDMLVASSQVWANGYSEEQRRAITCPVKSNHDLRECQAMIWFYRTKPTQWIPLPAYLSRL